MTASTRGDRAAGILLALLGVTVGIEASTFDVLFLTDPVGPKALPLVSASIFVVCGLRLAARPRAGSAWPGRGVLLRMVGALAAFGTYALLLEPLGFVVATTTTVAALSLLFGGPLRHSLGASAGLSVALWYLFVWLLALPLPLGTVWEALWRR